ncbi:MAG TPA: enoyl-CoA hydratase-related protein [Syntrophales bacterium]|nr:enoyl-CoA hydratase-related protein [Syntrophales bacterium]
MAYKFIDVKVENNVATLSLARTESLNALNLAFGKEITDAVRELNAREDVRVIILRSAARIFCSGLDLKDFMTLGLLGGGAKGGFFFKEKVKSLFDCCNVLEECRKPIIAAVHGQCVGGGLDIICACDIRLCSEDASFSLREAAIGFVADMGVLQRLPHIVGQGFAREMAYTARFFSAKEVEKMGLVNTVYPDQAALMEGAKTLADQIAANAPLAVMATKEVLNYSRTASIEEGMDMAIEKNAIFLNSKDIVEAATAFMEKRKPNFKGE